jgi:hypothetical protein
MILYAGNPRPPRRATNRRGAAYKGGVDSKVKRGHVKKMRSSKSFD